VIRLDHRAVIADLDELADRSGGRFAGAKRLAWTGEWRKARQWLQDKLGEVGVGVEVDAAGNLWAPIAGEREEFVIVGSHIDAVPDGGWLDGALGVLTALELIRQLAASGSRPPLGVRLVDWADEEGARFGRSLLGSSACAGTLDPAQVRELSDSEGAALVGALAGSGVELASMSSAHERLRGAVAYLELHIEQGPVLLESSRLASAVSGTVGVERHLVTFIGQTAHAGATPMRMRRDSLAAAARAALAIRESAIEHGGVATVGSIAPSPGVVTAVAGRTVMQLDQRHSDPDALAAMLEDARSACEVAARQFGCTAALDRIFSAAPTRFDDELVAAAREAVRDAGGGDGEPIPSGALHDATAIGRVVPSAMIFVQSDPPVSHTQVEDSPQPAIALAIDAYGRTVAAVLERAGSPRS
jgi:N-carbamoyl-L-amino-acid hydrolase